MALKDKLMTLEDFKAVRDVDVASNSAQFTELRADLGAQTDSIQGVASFAKTPEGEVFVQLELGNIVYQNSAISYANSTAYSTKRVRTLEDTYVHLSAGSTIKLTDYTNAKFYPAYRPDGETAWSYPNTWVATGEYVCPSTGDYVVLIANRTEVTQESAKALGDLLVVTEKDSYNSHIMAELQRKSLVKYNMDNDGYVFFGSFNDTIQPADPIKKERYSDKFSVAAGKTYVVDYKVKISSASDWYFTCHFYNSEGTMTDKKSWTGPTLEDDGYYHMTKKYTIASGVAFMRISGRTYGDCIACVYEDVSEISAIQTVFGRSEKERDEAISEAVDVVKSDNFPVMYSPIMYDYVVKGVNHRGYNTVAPENTMPAYALSKEHGFYYVETDVDYTSDGEYVLLHDETINRTARNADGTELTDTVNIHEITLAEAKTYDFGIWKSSEYAGTEIPTLEEFLIFCKRVCLHPYIELKFAYDAQKCQDVVNIVRKCGMKNRVTYISFTLNNLKAVASYDKSARLGMLYNAPQSANAELYAAEVDTLKTGCNEVFMDVRYHNDPLIAACISHDIGLELWTTDVGSATIIAKPDIVTGITHDTLHAGKVIYDDAVGTS